MLLTVSAHAMTLKRYEVSGSSSKELIASLEKNGPEEGWGAIEPDWAVKYEWTETDGEFKITSVTVSVAIVKTMPNWRGYSSASKCMKASWDAMYASLDRHEKKHIDLTKGVSERIKNAVSKLPAFNSQSTMQKSVDSVTKKFVEENNLVQSKFDQDTEHGSKDPTDPIILKSC